MKIGFLHALAKSIVTKTVVQLFQLLTVVNYLSTVRWLNYNEHSVPLKLEHSCVAVGWSWTENAIIEVLFAGRFILRGICWKLYIEWNFLI
jgi:hypothetical protein